MEPNAPIAHHKDGKDHLLVAHLREVGGLAQKFAGKLGLGSHGELIGLVHDLGKYSHAFQSYILSAEDLLDQDVDEDYVDHRALKGKIDHSTAGAQLIWDHLSKLDKRALVVGQLLALCVASHHSGLIDCLEPAGTDSFTRRMGKADDRTHRAEAMRKVDPALFARVQELLKPEVLNGAMGKTLQRIIDAEIAEAKAQGRSPLEDRILFQAGLLARYLLSCLLDADRLSTADFSNPKAALLRQHGEYEEWHILIDRLEAHLRTLSSAPPVGPILKRVSDACLAFAERDKGCYTLTVPTGGGKTLASLRFALRHAQKHGMHRIICCVPFTSIIDQNADVTRKILEPEGTLPGSIVLEHHSNLTPKEESWRNKTLAENWDAPLVYTTNVKFLEALFAGGTRDARRMHQLANAVLIFDEPQALPVNCLHLLNNAVNFLVEQCGSTVVLCTATQPQMHKVDSTNGRLRLSEKAEMMDTVGVANLFKELHRVDVLNRCKQGGWSDEEIAALAIKEQLATGSCLVVVNTKPLALRLYRICAAKGVEGIYHLSTSMCPAHRRKKLSEIRARLDAKQPVLCLSTQLIEAGVDIDFGCVVRSIAGLDSVAQAAGRCNRYAKRERGRVHIINPSDEKTGMLTAIERGKCATQKTMDEIAEAPSKFNGDLVATDVMERFFHHYYFEQRENMAYDVSAKNAERDDTLLRMLGQNSIAASEYIRTHNNKAAPLYLMQSFKTAGNLFKAIDAPTQGIIVPYGKEGKQVIVDLCAAYSPAEEFRLIRQAQQYTVNVYPNVLKKLPSGAYHEVQPGTGIFFLNEEYYSEDFGLSEERTNNMPIHAV